MKMYLEEAKNYFPEIDKEWDLEKLFKDLQEANPDKKIKDNLMFQIRFKGFLGSYSYQQIADRLNQEQSKQEVNNNQKLTDNTIKQYCNSKIIPYINSLLIDQIKSQKGERDTWVQIPGKLKDYRKGNRQEVIDMKEKMQRALLQLDYNQQIGKFKTSLEALNLVGTFLIHGNSQDHGQVWLLNRILHESNHETSDLSIRIRLSERQNMQKIMNFLGSELKCQENNSGDYSTAIIISAITQLWQTTRLWFSFYLDVRFTPVKGQVLNEFMTNFWQPLIRQIQSIDNESCHSIYLFFIEEKGCFTSWQASLKIRKDDDPILPILSEANPDCPYYPIDLGELEDWTWPVVQSWVNCHAKDLIRIGNINDRNAMIDDFRSIVQNNLRGISIMRDISDYLLAQSWDTISDKITSIL